VTGTEEELMDMCKMKQQDAHTAKLRAFLEASDTNGNGEMTSDELEAVLQHPCVEENLNVIGLTRQEIIPLFSVLDDGDGVVSHDELVVGIMKLSSGVHVIDTLKIMHAQKRIAQKLDRVTETMVVPASRHQKKTSARSPYIPSCPPIARPTTPTVAQESPPLSHFRKAIARDAASLC